MAGHRRVVEESFQQGKGLAGAGRTSGAHVLRALCPDTTIARPERAVSSEASSDTRGDPSLPLLAADPCTTTKAV